MELILIGEMILSVLIFINKLYVYWVMLVVFFCVFVIIVYMCVNRYIYIILLWFDKFFDGICIFGLILFIW